MFIADQAHMIQGPRRAVGFAAVEAHDTIFKQCYLDTKW